MTGLWVIGGASMRGAAHVRRDLPNQDAIGWQPQGGPARHFVAAVSDGHGAAAHFRSDVGARLAVESAASVLAWFLDGDGDGDGDEAALAALPSQILAAWQQAVQAHAAVTPAGDWVESSADRLLPYGATLIAAAATDELAVALQIGDGDLYFGYPDGRLERPLPDDRGLVGEQTHSLCAPHAASRFRVAVLRSGAGAALPDFVMLSSDGASKSFADEAAFRDVGAHYRRAMLSPEAETVFASLPDWLEQVSRRGSGDDITLFLAARRGA